MTTFIPGGQLNDLFYRQVIRVILDERFPGVRHSAALLGHGSEVLGYDTPLSTDHHWGLRMLLFLSDEDLPVHGETIARTLRRELPVSFRGVPTHFGPPDSIGVRLLQSVETGPVDHMIGVTTVACLFHDLLGVDPCKPPAVVDWLTFPQQELLGVTEGWVFHDGLGTLEEARGHFRWYPHDVWLYLLAAQWQRIAQQEAFVGRCGDVGDELGSSLVAANIVRDLMRLCFLMERRYAPYSKWFGTAFSRLRCAAALQPLLSAVQAAAPWREREERLAAAYGTVARMHNRLGITEQLPDTVSRYHNRPYLVIHADRFVAAIRAAIGDAQVLRLPMIGSIDQCVDSTDVLTRNEVRERFKKMYLDG